MAESSQKRFQNNNSLSNFRLVSGFNEIYEYIIFDIFLWTFLTICISLLFFLVKLVEYTIWDIKDNFDFENWQFHSLWKRMKIDFNVDLLFGFLFFIGLFSLSHRNISIRLIWFYHSFSSNGRSSSFFSFANSVKLWKVNSMPLMKSYTKCNGFYFRWICKKWSWFSCQVHKIPHGFVALEISNVVEKRLKRLDVKLS